MYSARDYPIPRVKWEPHVQAEKHSSQKGCSCSHHRPQPSRPWVQAKQMLIRE